MADKNELTKSDIKKIEEEIESFKLENKRSPNDDELFYIKAFVNDHVIQSL